MRIARVAFFTAALMLGFNYYVVAIYLILQISIIGREIVVVRH